MKKHSAGILLFRDSKVAIEVFLVHPGGPFWARKDDGAWSVPKGEYAEDEDALVAAKREFAEETGVVIDGVFLSLGEVTQASGKLVKVWALKYDLNPDNLKSNTFELEWPPRSGRMREFPEVDSWAWFPFDLAGSKIIVAQREFLARLSALLKQH